ncbi:MAG: hypothetical protein AAF715_27955, partial [Myxococcota bacterium]
MATRVSGPRRRRGRFGRGLALAAIFGVGLTAPGRGFAADEAPSEIDRDAARTSVQQGDERAEGGDFRGALEAYRRADDIMGVPTTAIEVGRMHEELGELVAARAAYLRAAKYPTRAGEPRPVTPAR